MSLDETIWVHSASIKSSVLLYSKDDDVRIPFPEGKKEVRFSVPEPIEDERWGGWETTLRSTWLYKVSIEFPVMANEDAESRAYKNLDNLVNIMSFMASSPVRVENYGSIKTPPSEGIPGQIYTQIVLDAKSTHLTPRELTITGDAIAQQLGPMFMYDVLSKEGGERISRSLRWLQHSYQATTPVDEFLCLMFSLEGVAMLLGEGKPLYWRCERCSTQYQECPNCGESTARTSSGSALVRDFLKLYAGWSSKKWNALWSLRSKIAHGDQDLSKSEESTIIASISELEHAVIKALKFVLKLPDQALLQSTRFRPLFVVGGLTITHHAPEDNEGK